ncbi:MAG: TPM domain-containing protein [Lachnospiraceae bacterium]|nr:TPM domain-containing protein [Lachnospiraceae bacterium]
MLEIKRRHFAALAALFLLTPWLLLSAALPVFAAEGTDGIYWDETDSGWAYDNPSTGYSAYFYDYADIFSEEEELSLMQENVVPITEYGHAVFISDITEDTSGGAAAYASNLSYNRFGKDSNLVLMIDMGIRDIALADDGAIGKRVNQNYTTLITDNIYSYASKGAYYLCVEEAFVEALTLLEGGHIATPMRHITNLLIAVVLGLLGNFIYVWVSKRKIKVADGQILALAAGSLVASSALNRTLLKTHKTRSSSSSGGGGGGHSSGGGGGFSGNVGSHRF